MRYPRSSTKSDLAKQCCVNLVAVSSFNSTSYGESSLSLIQEMTSSTTFCDAGAV